MASSSRAAGGAADLADSGTTDHVRPGDGAPDGAESGSGQDSRAAGGAAAGPAPSLASRLLVLPIRAYQRFLSPALPPACRFTPTCSEYAVVAISRHGPFKGSWLAVRRLARCHPWHPGGDDPVP